VSEKVLEHFRNYTWPGNIRELENCLRRAVILCAGDVILEEHIELLDKEREQGAQEVNQQKVIDRLTEKVQDILPEIMNLFREGVHANVIETVEKAIILKVLEECGNNQVKAAEMLGISRNTLRHRLKKYEESI
jgi:DNA-binding NtrC family response regulator